MTPDERNLLQRFLQDLAQTPSGGKDPEADAMIGAALRNNPDAAYVLVQHAILSDQALQAAQTQIAALQAQGASGPPRSFLCGSGASPWQGQPQQPQYQPQPMAPPGPPAGYMGPGPFSSEGGLGSFLRQAGTTAAGVAGGAFLFEGLSGLFGGHGGGGGGLGGWGAGGGGFGAGGLGGGGQPTVENVTNNNYYDDDDSDDDNDNDWDDDDN